MAIYIEKGWDETHSTLIAELYDDAFGSKFRLAIPHRKKRILVLSNSFQPEYSFIAYRDDKIVGLSGFNVTAGSLTGGIDAKELLKSLGLFRGLLACAVFSLFERHPKKRELVMDGIAVISECRGQGIGSLLLDQIITYAKNSKLESVRLDVIDTNPRARKLYESKGFIAVKTENYPYLKWLIGFSGSTTMKLDLRNIADEIKSRENC